MTTSYTGNPANGARTPALAVDVCVDGDAANGANLSGAEKKIADYVAWLQAHAAIFDAANTFTAAQVIQALLSLTNNLAFSAAVAQTLLKTAAGGLTVGTAASGGDLTLSANGVALLKLLATGSLDAQAKILGNLATPVAAADAATKGWVEGIAAGAIGVVSAGSAWVVDGYHLARNGNAVVVDFEATAGAGASWSAVATLQSGFRPPVQIAALPCTVYDASVSTYYPGLAVFGTTGVVAVTLYSNGGGFGPLFTIATGDRLLVRAAIVGA
jgi:hypothetical protein